MDKRKSLNKVGVPELSYYIVAYQSFPRLNERRQLRLSALGYSDHHPFPKIVEICSKHSNNVDFKLKQDGSKLLNRDAVPSVVHSAFNPSAQETPGMQVNINVWSTIIKYSVEATMCRNMNEKLKQIFGYAIAYRKGTLPSAFWHWLVQVEEVYYPIEFEIRLQDLGSKNKHFYIG
nr:unnamed protein product [Callosobruchus analis]